MASLAPTPSKSWPADPAAYYDRHFHDLFQRRRAIMEELDLTDLRRQPELGEHMVHAFDPVTCSSMLLSLLWERDKLLRMVAAHRRRLAELPHK